MNKTKFTQWGQLLECKTLKASQRVILGIILNLHNLDDWDFTPLSVLEEKSGISVSTIQRSIKGLVKIGLIEKVSNRNRKKYGKDPNDYIPNYTNILNLLNSQIGQNDHNSYSQNDHNNQIGQNDHNNQIGQNDHNSYSQNDHNVMVKMTNKNNRKKEKEKNKASIYNNNNLSTRRYMVYSENENENKQNTNDMNIIINETENGNPINALLGFEKADERGWDSSSNVETATADNKSALNGYAAGNNNTNSTETDTDNPNAALLGFDKAFEKGWDSSTDVEETAARNNKSNNTEADPTAADAQKAPKNDRDEEIIPQVDNYTTHIEKTPQERYFDNMGADTADATENGADTADARPIYNTIHAADEWSIRNAEDTCWQETLEHVTTNLSNPSENEIRTLLNKTYGDWKNRDEAINAKMITDMKKYAEYKYQMDLNKKEKRDTVNYQTPKSDAYPTVTEIENLDLCHISKNRDILNRLSAGCTRLDTVILSLNKAIEFTQIYRIATPQLYDCISNAMATINNCQAISDKKYNYVADLAENLCKMLSKVC